VGNGDVVLRLGIKRIDKNSEGLKSLHGIWN
jgi:hypothetical protein